MKALENLTIDQIRTAMDNVEASYFIALENNAPGLVLALHNKLMMLWFQLVELIQKDDKFTTEADIRHFEGRSWVV